MPSAFTERSHVYTGIDQQCAPLLGLPRCPQNPQKRIPSKGVFIQGSGLDSGIFVMLGLWSGSEAL